MTDVCTQCHVILYMVCILNMCKNQILVLEDIMHLQCIYRLIQLFIWCTERHVYNTLWVLIILNLLNILAQHSH